MVETGGATAADYESPDLSVTFAAGERSASASVRAVDDARVDDGEGLRIEFDDLPDGVGIDPRRQLAAFAIIDNDGLPGTSVADTSVTEWPNPQSELEFVVELDQAVRHVVRVDYGTSDGTAVAASDYRAMSGTLVFNPGERSKIVSVQVHDDRQDEDTETMTLRLSGAEGGRLGDGIAQGRIRNRG